MANLKRKIPLQFYVNEEEKKMIRKKMILSKTGNMSAFCSSVNMIKLTQLPSVVFLFPAVFPVFPYSPLNAYEWNLYFLVSFLHPFLYLSSSQLLFFQVHSQVL